MAHAPTRLSLPAEQVSLPPGHPLGRLCTAAGVVGLLALMAAFALGQASPQRLFASYLTAFVYGVMVALGCLFFVLVLFATRAGWGITVRRLAEHGAATLPLFVLLFVPLIFGLGELYDWTHADAMAHDALLAGKAPWLNRGGFVVRSFVYLLAWAVIAWWFRRRSLAQDVSRDPGVSRTLRALSAPALVVFGVTLTFAGFDSVMSLDPHWYSTIFGVYLFSGAAVAMFALLPLLAMALERWGAAPLEGIVTAEHYHDLGKLLFGFVVFWAYIAFSQFMLIWYGNIPEETVWYAERWTGGWRQVSILLAVAHFAVPFFYLLLRRTKRDRRLLAAACVWLLVVHYLDVYWLVMPAFGSQGPGFRLLDLLTWIGVCGLFLGALGLLMRRPALVPVGDPRLPESMSFENM